MNILVTGASGFIGSYLCDFFIRQGHRVVATARDVTKVPAINNERFQIVEWDVMDKEGLETSDLPVIDSVVHTATSNDILARKVGDGILLSTVGTKNVLDFCVKNGISQMVFFSTFQVYGTDLEGIVDEDTVAKCQNDYGLNHIFGEQYMEMYAREKGIAGIAVRPSNVYGRFTTSFIDRWTLVPGCFCKEIAETGKITLRSSGRQTRNFVNLENIGRALHQILPRHKTGFEIYNIASSQNFSMLDVANMVVTVYEKRYSKKGKIEILSDLPAEKNSFSVDLQKLHEAGFTEDEKFNLISVIDEIFIYLENKK